MRFDEKLASKMKEKGIKNVKELSALCGIPYTTIRHWEGKSPDIIKFENIRVISKFFGVSVAYWVDDNDNSPFDVTAHERELITAYRASSDDTQKAVCSVLGVAKKNGTEACSEMA